MVFLSLFHFPPTFHVYVFAFNFKNINEKVLPATFFLSLALDNILSKGMCPDLTKPAGLSNYKEAENKEKITPGNRRQWTPC